MKKLIRKLTRIELVLVYLVILAGSVVRMTGSGMGCPDWPKCFGYLIPPTERSQLEWEPNRKFEKGQIVIVDETLQVAQEDFTTGKEFNPEYWETYTKHDYAVFNPFHTWTEYINRLFGALSGIPMLILVGVGLYYLKRDWRNFVLAAVGLFLLGFEAWLGKLVVDGHLIPGSITIHMMGALAVVSVLLVLLGINTKFPRIRYTDQFRVLLLISIIFTLIQTVIGTQVREQIDILNATGVARENWIYNLDWEFYVHRSFSIFILGINLWLWWDNRQYEYGFKEMNWILALVLAEVFLGILLNYVSFPRFAQPLHLLLGTILFGFQGFALVRMALSEYSRVIKID